MIKPWTFRRAKAFTASSAIVLAASVFLSSGAKASAQGLESCDARIAVKVISRLQPLIDLCVKDLMRRVSGSADCAAVDQYPASEWIACARGAFDAYSAAVDAGASDMDLRRQISGVWTEAVAWRLQQEHRMVGIEAMNARGPR